MEKPFSFCFIFFTICFCIIISVANSCHEFSVIIFNDNIKEAVEVECKEKDDPTELTKYVTVSYNESFLWTLCEDEKSHPTKTVHWCDFKLGKKHQRLDVFNYTVRPGCMGKSHNWKCTWLIRHDGFYFVDRRTVPPKQRKSHDWKLITSLMHRHGFKFGFDGSFLVGNKGAIGSRSGSGPFRDSNNFIDTWIHIQVRVRKVVFVNKGMLFTRKNRKWSCVQRGWSLRLMLFD
ncbi:hypothetical protein L6452_29863 [Arctium lappa]|uniref:Uncharacterized protein n=1 Tax=Arctium lappa TaxID=4217 RepID=A0ACB8ZHQ6_ARCLA|nr:hypothetical protein L6452_29863 [Arctium lappa]